MLEEKHKLLTIMLDAVYVDLLNNRSIVGILPKPAFYRLFESLKQKPDSKVIIFNPKENAPDSAERVVGLVETGESRSPSYRNITDLLVQRRVFIINLKNKRLENS